MRLEFKKKTDARVIARLKKRVKIRKRVKGTTECPRLCVFRSSRHIYAQLVDDLRGYTLGATSSLKLETSDKAGIELAKLVGTKIASLAKEKNIDKVVFDRSGYLYHGKIKALADAAREAGLQF